MKLKGQATLVGYRQGARKDGTLWRMVTLLDNGDTIRGFLSDECELNGARDKVAAGELIPVDVVATVRERRGGGVNFDVVQLVERTSASAASGK